MTRLAIVPQTLFPFPLVLLPKKRCDTPKDLTTGSAWKFPLVLLPKKRCDQLLVSWLSGYEFPLVLLPKKRCDDRLCLSHWRRQDVSISSASEEALWLDIETHAVKAEGVSISSASEEALWQINAGGLPYPVGVSISSASEEALWPNNRFIGLSLISFH